MVKTLKNLLVQNQERFEAESWYILNVYQIRSNDDRRFTFDILTARLNLRFHEFVWEKCWKVIFSNLY